jgi:anti-anti-sigma regulatory factor
MSAPEHIIKLVPVLDLTAAEPLQRELLSAFAEGGAVTVDASPVQRVSSPCLQVLAAAVRLGARVTDASPAFDETARTLDLTGALGLEIANV